MEAWLVNSFAADFREYLDNAECILFKTGVEIVPKNGTNQNLPYVKYMAVSKEKLIVCYRDFGETISTHVSFNRNIFTIFY